MEAVGHRKTFFSGVEDIALQELIFFFIIIIVVVIFFFVIIFLTTTLYTSKYSTGA